MSKRVMQSLGVYEYGCKPQHFIYNNYYNRTIEYLKTIILKYYHC